ncbi:angiotensin-converting enzyme isoform X3 [Phymastichus coffea]|uniref:angiotensin-converting enzyme isoform X3 n=1 Tax=Phymastichus coffea TaxID=108790 RepID=UPI00273C2E98|nr:angiotensin-converting enzyme isoform X3 [Phymastichus coffea]
MEVVHRPVFVGVVAQRRLHFMTITLLLLLVVHLVSCQLDLPPLRDDLYDRSEDRRQLDDERYDRNEGRRLPDDDDRFNRNRQPFQDDRRYDDRDRDRQQPFQDDRRYDDRDRDRQQPFQDERRYDDRDRDRQQPFQDERFDRERNRQQPFQDERFDRNGNRRPFQDNDRYRPPEPDLRNLLASLDFVGTQRCSNNVAAQWNYETNVNLVSQLQALQAQRHYADFQFHSWQQINKIDPNSVRDPTTRRRLRYLSAVGPAALPPDQFDRYNRLINDMLSIYNSATICAYKDPLRCGLRLFPEISTIMARSRDWDELQWVWLEWRRRSGSQMKDLYHQLVNLNNEAARMNNFTDAADYWQFPYESFDFEREIDDVWEQIKPLYEELHAYVRKRLRDLYGPEKISGQAPLPGHILGNIWGQSWTNILDMTQPYPGKNYLDVTQEMIDQGYTPIDMFRVGENFFISLNLSALPPEFWAGSLIVDPGDRPLICQASAWDFCNRIDYRIKMCTKVTMKDLITVHHEMAHIQYFLRYSHLPREFRDGANPGFHEAVGEAVALSIATPKHLQTLGLGNKYVDEGAADINYLFALAMEKLVLLPYSIALDKWRWDIFRGVVGRQEYNCHWHRLKERYAGVKPPYLRSEDDFDPGAKYHIPANIPYIRIRNLLFYRNVDLLLYWIRNLLGYFDFYGHWFIVGHWDWIINLNLDGIRHNFLHWDRNVFSHCYRIGFDNWYWYGIIFFHFYRVRDDFIYGDRLRIVNGNFDRDGERRLYEGLGARLERVQGSMTL